MEQEIKASVFDGKSQKDTTTGTFCCNYITPDKRLSIIKQSSPMQMSRAPVSRQL